MNPSLRIELFYRVKARMLAKRPSGQTYHEDELIKEALAALAEIAEIKLK